MKVHFQKMFNAKSTSNGVYASRFIPPDTKVRIDHPETADIPSSSRGNVTNNLISIKAIRAGRRIKIHESSPTHEENDGIIATYQNNNDTLYHSVGVNNPKSKKRYVCQCATINRTFAANGGNLNVAAQNGSFVTSPTTSQLIDAWNLGLQQSQQQQQSTPSPLVKFNLKPENQKPFYSNLTPFVKKYSPYSADQYNNFNAYDYSNYSSSSSSSSSSSFTPKISPSISTRLNFDQQANGDDENNGNDENDMNLPPLEQGTPQKGKNPDEKSLSPFTPFTRYYGDTSSLSPMGNFVINAMNEQKTKSASPDSEDLIQSSKKLLQSIDEKDELNKQKNLASDAETYLNEYYDAAKAYWNVSGFGKFVTSPSFYKTREQKNQYNRRMFMFNRSLPEGYRSKDKYIQGRFNKQLRHGLLSSRDYTKKLSILKADSKIKQKNIKRAKDNTYDDDILVMEE